MSQTEDAAEPGVRGRSRPPTPRFKARRRAIIASAVAELNRKGIRGMTLGDVAARLDLVSTGVIYYFKNKEELAAACFQLALARYEAILAQAETGETPRDRIARFIALYFEFKRQAALGEAEQIAVFNDVRALGAEAVNSAYVAMFRRVRRLFDAPGAARLAPMHRNARAHLLLSEMFWAVPWLQDIEIGDYGRAADRVTSILWDGLAAPGAAWTQPPLLDLTRDDDPAKDASSELFLRAATKLINAEGYHGASVERISSELHVSKGAFYHHNDTKDELVVACFRRTFEFMWRAIHAAEARGGSRLEVLAAVCSTLVAHQFGGASPLLRTSALTTVPESLQHVLLADLNRLSLRFASILCDGVADGSIRPLDVNIAAQMITGMINAAAELHYWAPDLSVETATEHYVRPLFTGLARLPTA